MDCVCRCIVGCGHSDFTIKFRFNGKAVVLLTHAIYIGCHRHVSSKVHHGSLLTLHTVRVCVEIRVIIELNGRSLGICSGGKGGGVNGRPHDNRFFLRALIQPIRWRLGITVHTFLLKILEFIHFHWIFCKIFALSGGLLEEIETPATRDDAPRSTLLKICSYYFF